MIGKIRTAKGTAVGTKKQALLALAEEAILPDMPSAALLPKMPLLSRMEGANNLGKQTIKNQKNLKPHDVPEHYLTK